MKKNKVWFTVEADWLNLFFNTLNILIRPELIEEFIKDDSNDESIVTYYFEGNLTKKEIENLVFNCEKDNQVLMKLVYDYKKKIYEIICFNKNIEEINKKLKYHTTYFEYFVGWKNNWTVRWNGNKK